MCKRKCNFCTGVYRCTWCQWPPICPYARVCGHAQLSTPSTPKFIDALQTTENDFDKEKPKKSRIPKDALQILRESANSDEKSDNASPKTNTKQPQNKPEASKKKPKTHFRKTKKPGRA